MGSKYRPLRVPCGVHYLLLEVKRQSGSLGTVWLGISGSWLLMRFSSKYG